MPEIRISPRAELDLTDIWQSTARRWGEDQANLYIDDLSRTFQALSEFPDLGVDCGWIRAGYRRLVANRHLVFYRVFEEDVEIVRILHERMDVESNL